MKFCRICAVICEEKYGEDLKCNAVNCLGNVLMSNVALRGNVAEDGGAIYFEGMLEV